MPEKKGGETDDLLLSKSGDSGGVRGRRSVLRSQDPMVDLGGLYSDHRGANPG